MSSAHSALILHDLLIMTSYLHNLEHQSHSNVGFDSNLVTCNSTSVLYAEGTPAGFLGGKSWRLVLVDWYCLQNEPI